MGGVHLKMPDCIGDERALKRTVRQNHELIEAAGDKIKKAAEGLKGNRPPREGLGFGYHAAGCLGKGCGFMVRRRIIRIGCMWMRISVLAAENVFRCVLWIIWNCGRERLSRGDAVRCVTGV